MDETWPMIEELEYTVILTRKACRKDKNWEEKRGGEGKKVVPKK